MLLWLRISGKGQSRMMLAMTLFSFRKASARLGILGQLLRCIEGSSLRSLLLLASYTRVS